MVSRLSESSSSSSNSESDSPYQSSASKKNKNTRSVSPSNSDQSSSDNETSSRSNSTSVSGSSNESGEENVSEKLKSFSEEKNKREHEIEKPPEPERNSDGRKRKKLKNTDNIEDKNQSLTADSVKGNKNVETFRTYDIIIENFTPVSENDGNNILKNDNFAKDDNGNTKKDENINNKKCNINNIMLEDLTGNLKENDSDYTKPKKGNSSKKNKTKLEEEREKNEGIMERGHKIQKYANISPDKAQNLNDDNAKLHIICKEKEKSKTRSKSVEIEIPPVETIVMSDQTVQQNYISTTEIISKEKLLSKKDNKSRKREYRSPSLHKHTETKKKRRSQEHDTRNKNYKRRYTPERNNEIRSRRQKSKSRSTTPKRSKKEAPKSPSKEQHRTTKDTITDKNEKKDHPDTSMSARQRRAVDLLTSKTGGAYIPPAKLRLLQAEITDKTSAAYQRIAWEALKKSIHGYINKVNVDNIGIITRELLKENIIRGRGLLCRSIIQAQAASPTFTHVYAALVAIINSKFPDIGELLLKRLVVQFKRGYRRNDKAICLSSSRFIAHLVNQCVAHEILALEILTLLVENPTDDSVEVAISFLREAGMKLTEVSPKGIAAIFDMLKNALNEEQLDIRVQYMIEVVFQVRKYGFKDHESVIEPLDVITEQEQYTHLLTLNDTIETQDNINVFKFDEKYQENETKYTGLKKEILGTETDSNAGSDNEEDTSDEDEEDDNDGDEEENGKKASDTIIDNTETNLIGLRRTIYLTIHSSLDYEECAHKLMKMELKPGQESELCHMFLDCCAEQRTYEKFYGLLSQRFCSINKIYIEPFEEIFKATYSTTHRLDTNRLRNVSKFFAHLLFTDAIGWDVMECIRLNEEETTSSSRIFIKILFQELAEYMGLSKLNERLKHPEFAESFSGLFPRDNPKNSRFAINFFTSIGLGGLTDDLRQFLKSAPKPTPSINQLEKAVSVIDVSTSDSSSSSSSSDSSDSSTSSSSSTESDSSSKKKSRKKKKNVMTKKKKSVRKRKNKNKKGRKRQKSSTSNDSSSSSSDSDSSSNSKVNSKKKQKKGKKSKLRKEKKDTVLASAVVISRNPFRNKDVQTNRNNSTERYSPSENHQIIKNPPDDRHGKRDNSLSKTKKSEKKLPSIKSKNSKQLIDKEDKDHQKSMELTKMVDKEDNSPSISKKLKSHYKVGIRRSRSLSKVRNSKSDYRDNRSLSKHRSSKYISDSSRSPSRTRKSKSDYRDNRSSSKLKKSRHRRDESQSYSPSKSKNSKSHYRDIRSSSKPKTSNYRADKSRSPSKSKNSDYRNKGSTSKKKKSNYRSDRSRSLSKIRNSKSDYRDARSPSKLERSKSDNRDDRSLSKNLNLKSEYRDERSRSKIRKSKSDYRADRSRSLSKRRNSKSDYKDDRSLKTSKSNYRVDRSRSLSKIRDSKSDHRDVRSPSKRNRSKSSYGRNRSRSLSKIKTSKSNYRDNRSRSKSKKSKLNYRDDRTRSRSSSKTRNLKLNYRGERSRSLSKIRNSKSDHRDYRSLSRPKKSNRVERSRSLSKTRNPKSNYQDDRGTNKLQERNYENDGSRSPSYTKNSDCRESRSPRKIRRSRELSNDEYKVENSEISNGKNKIKEYHNKEKGESYSSVKTGLHRDESEERQYRYDRGDKIDKIRGKKLTSEKGKYRSKDGEKHRHRAEREKDYLKSRDTSQ